MHGDIIYDVIIIGGGPGGYTAALYCARAGLNTLILEKMYVGGQIALTSQIDNYPGFPEGVDGLELALQMQQGAERFGAVTKFAEVRSAELDRKIKLVETDSGAFQAHTVILATGAVPRTLGVPGEAELVGKGVSYCAHCDGMFYKGKTAVVVGGGNTAVADALYLSRICEKVIMVHRRDTLRATKVYHEQLKRTGNVEFLWNSMISELLHNTRLTGVRIRNLITGEEAEIACDGLFVCIGRKPASDLVKGQLELDETGYVIAGESTQTNIPGVYAVGDVRTKELRQIITAANDGAAASHHVQEYLSKRSAAKRNASDVMN